MVYVRWPITITAITRRNTVNKENLTNQKVLRTYRKGLPPYKQNLLIYTKKDSLIYIQKNKRRRQILTANSHDKFSNMQYRRWCGAILCVGELHA